MKLIYSILIAILSISVLSCRIEQKEKKGPLNIVVTTGIIEDGVENIVGDSAEVTALMGPGTDPHLYKPTPMDIELLDEADVIIANGLHLEGKMAEMLAKYGEEKPVIEVGQGVKKERLIRLSEGEDSYDPHIWFDPEMWMDGMRHVTQRLGEIDTVSANYYTEKYNTYASEVMEMDNWIKEELNQLDTNARVLITSHDAFSYFGRRYNVEVRGIQGVSTLSEVGLKDVADMVDFIIARDIKSVFIETSTSEKTAQSIIDGTADKGYTLEKAGPLYSDALGEPDTPSGTYIGMAKANVTAIIKGLKK